MIAVKIVENAHWLHADMSAKPNLVQLLTCYPPGTVLNDKCGKYWRRQAKIAVTWFHFLTPVGTTQENFYEQKYLLNVPLTGEDKVITVPPRSWMQLCVEKGLCDTEGDALSCLHIAVSKGLYEEFKSLVQLRVCFLSTSDGDAFMADIPLGVQAVEEEAEVTDALPTDPGSEYGTLLPNTKQNLHSYAGTFTPSQGAAFQWLTGKLDSGDKLSAAIIGPAGTGKSYVLSAVVAYCRKKGLVVASTIAHTTAVVNVPFIGSGELKPPPDIGWQKQASATPFMHRSSAPEPINSAECSEILPHLLDKDTGDGHCGFRALSRSITATGKGTHFQQVQPTPREAVWGMLLHLPLLVLLQPFFMCHPLEVLS